MILNVQDLQQRKPESPNSIIRTLNFSHFKTYFFTFFFFTNMLILLQILILASQLPSTLAIPATLARQTAAPKLTLGHIKAAVPTSAGQIGINPIDRDLGDALHYSGYINSIDANYVSEAFATVNSDTNSITSSTKVGIYPLRC